jgi:hypothetical protein
MPLDLNIPDRIQQLLFAGIGIYCPSSNMLNQAYHEAVLSLASDGKLAFLISDGSISYGANYPFSHIVITDEIAVKHSINTLFQLAGRAGRVGTSWVAFAHVGPKTAERIMNYVQGKTGTGISEEAKNLKDVYHKVLDEERKRKEEKENMQSMQLLHSKVEPEKPKYNLVSIDQVKQRAQEKSEKNQNGEKKSDGRRKERNYASWDAVSTDTGNRRDDRPHDDRGYNRRDDRPRDDRGYNRRDDRPRDDRGYNRRDDRPREDRPRDDRRSQSRYDPKDSQEGSWQRKTASDSQIKKPGAYVPPHLRNK